MSLQDMAGEPESIHQHYHNLAGLITFFLFSQGCSMSRMTEKARRQK